MPLVVLTVDIRMNSHLIVMIPSRLRNAKHLSVYSEKVAVMVSPRVRNVTITAQIFTAMCIFELLFRDEISPISCAHHIGAIVVAQSADTMSFDAKHERDAL